MHGVNSFIRPALRLFNGGLWNWHASPSQLLYPSYNGQWVIYIREEGNGIANGFMYDSTGNLITSSGLSGGGCDYFELISKYDVDIHEISFNRMDTNDFDRDFHVKRLVSELNN
jgi:hypothetical protein